MIYSLFKCPTGEMIISNDRYHMTETENSMYAVQMTLVIRKLQKSDMGGYKCISKNSIGDAEGTIRIYGEFKLFYISLRLENCKMLTTLYCRVMSNVFYYCKLLQLNWRLEGFFCVDI